MKIGLITSTDDPELCRDDRLVYPHLAKLGITATPFVWDTQTNFQDYDAFVFRSCWNYHRKFTEFLQWLTLLEKSGKKILNPVADSRWNLHKKYLFTLKDFGIPVPDTELIERNSRFDLKDLLSRISGNKIVVKPAISLNGLETTLREKTDLAAIQKDLDIILHDRDAFLQEFIPGIKYGEISLIYLLGKFSHAIRKVPAQNEFRVHAEYGGSRIPFTPDENLLSEIEKLVTLRPSLLFSRVDIALTNDSWKLIEWEIIDPMLYLEASPGSAERFAEAIHTALK